MSITKLNAALKQAETRADAAEKALVILKKDLETERTKVKIQTQKSDLLDAQLKESKEKPVQKSNDMDLERQQHANQIQELE